ncbi:MAG: hypothetical protein IH595_14865 [Bacteroidales bacterium]|nr:hypothetical protein [Bacteroidales bacterium]
MKKLFYFAGLSAVLAVFMIACSKNQNTVNYQQPDFSFKTIKAGTEGNCSTIQSGTIFYSASHYYGAVPIKTGYDDYGYNYQAHMFSGSYANAYLGGYGFPPYKGDDATYIAQNPTIVNQAYAWFWNYRKDNLVMKWNDAWLSNKDCDGDGKLDRHFGFESYVGSGAWETNHMWGTYKNGKGKTCHWDDFVKVEAVPSNATLTNGVWYTTDGKVMGTDIWGQFAIIEEVTNDPCGAIHGIQYRSPDHPGFGGW